MRDWVRERRRYQTWIRVASDLAFGSAPSNCHDILAAHLCETFDAVGCTFNTADAHWTVQTATLWSVVPVPAPDELPRVPDATWQPLLRWYAHTKDRAPQTIAAIPRDSLPHDLRGEWNDFARPLQIEQQIGIPLQLAGVANGGYVIGRPDDDFSDEDREFAELLQPLLGAVLRQQNVLQKLQVPVEARTLTNRELAVLCLVAQGMTAAAIARRLAISPRTVNKHLEHTYRKLGASDRVTALLRARDLGYHLSMPEPSA